MRQELVGNEVLRRNFEVRGGKKQIAVIFSDLSKAFDVVIRMLNLQS